jgi:hypothetical protein
MKETGRGLKIWVSDMQTDVTKYIVYINMSYYMRKGIKTARKTDKMDLREIGCNWLGVWSGLRIRTDGELFWHGHESLGFWRHGVSYVIIHALLLPT